MKFLTSKKALVLCMALTFGFFLLLNILTPLCLDDYQYLYSWNDWTRITSISQIFPSMYTHGQIMNGRILCHFLVQLFLLLPGIIFDILNALAFTCLIYLGFHTATWHSTDMDTNSASGTRNALYYLVLAGFTWYYVPKFGQTNLWLDGSINYLWALVMAMVYIRVYWKLFVNYDSFSAPALWKQILFWLFSWYAGAFTEMSSLTMITGAVLFLILIKAVHKNKIPVWSIISLVFAVAGFLFMFLQPGEQANRVVTSPSLITFVNKFIIAVEQMNKYLYVLLILWCVLFACCIYFKTKLEILCTSAAFFLLCLAANVFTIAGSEYPDRVMYPCTFYLILANCSLLFSIARTKHAVFSTALCAGYSMVFLFQIILGTYDVFRSYDIYCDRDAYIKEQLANGNKEVMIELVKPRTKYSVLYETRDLGQESVNEFPNYYIAKYYGLDSIIGYEEDTVPDMGND